MYKQFSISDAKNRLPAIVHAIENGPAVQLTRHGKPVAVLISISKYNRLTNTPKNFWTKLNAFRESIDASTLLSSNDIFFNNRDNSPGREINFEQ
jgi:prevent-host-death family protein